jgi:outer membrane protein OmpA-like peptidoglycan-associated protein
MMKRLLFPLVIALLIAGPGCRKPRVRRDAAEPIVREVTPPAAPEPTKPDVVLDEDIEELDLVGETAKNLMAPTKKGTEIKEVVLDEEEEEASGATWDSQYTDEYGLKPIHFEFDHDDLRPDQIAVLEYDLKTLKGILAKKDVTIYISTEGHTCRFGSDAYNMALSVRRAKTVQAYLTKHGIPKETIGIVGRGSTMPRVRCDGDRQAQGPNRRVQFRIIEKQPTKGHAHSVK